MDQRTILAVTLSILVLLVYNNLVVKPKPVLNNTVITQVLDNKQVTTNIEKSFETKTAVISPRPHSVNENIIEEIQTIENNDVKIEFSNIGGKIKTVTYKKHAYQFPITDILSLPDYNDLKFDLIGHSNDQISYSYTDSTGLTVLKKFDISNDKNTVNSEIIISDKANMSNLSKKQFVNFMINTEGINEETVPQTERSLFEYSISYADVIFRKGNAYTFSDKDKLSKEFNVGWTGFRDRFFCALVKPVIGTASDFSVNPVDKNKLQIVTSVNGESAQFGETMKYQFLLYFGPQDTDLLKGANQDFPKIVVFSNFSPIDAISKIILKIMQFSHKIVPNWGIAIIIISVVVYFSMYPLTLKGMLSMRKMQALQPRMAQLREQHKSNPQKLNKEIMVLYKENGVNPLGGCLPFLLQMPVFIALYQALWRTVHLKGASFLWIKDLAAPDRFLMLPTTLPIIGNELNILPIVMGVVMFFQQKLSSKNIVITDESQVMQQKMMLIFFPVFLAFIFYKFASGLTLYFTLFYLFSTMTQWKMSKLVTAIK